ncbi:unnamed protein product [Absidia cylindrospora]
MTDATAFSFLALTSFADDQQADDDNNYMRMERRESSTHDNIEWVLYGTEDHSLLQAHPPHAFLTLTAEKNEQESVMMTNQQDPSTHEPSLYHTE